MLSPGCGAVGFGCSETLNASGSLVIAYPLESTIFAVTEKVPEAVGVHESGFVVRGRQPVGSPNHS